MSGSEETQQDLLKEMRDLLRGLLEEARESRKRHEVITEDYRRLVRTAKPAIIACLLLIVVLVGYLVWLTIGGLR